MRLHPVFLFILLTLCPAWAQTPPATNTPGVSPRALPVDPAELANAQTPIAVPDGVNVHWYGHGFIYLTSSVGIRCAIDPFGPNIVHYKFPVHLASDFVLITHEADDHGDADQIFGNPLIFRSVMAVGYNRANGIPFYGTALKNSTGRGGSNTAFTITFDGVKFCYLGQVSQPLLAQEREQLGHADVVFLPVGLTTIAVGDFNKIAQDLGASMIIPINYKTDFSGILELRTLEDYLSQTKFPVRKVDSDEIIVTHSSLPATPTVYVLKSP